MTRTHCECGAELWQGECLEQHKQQTLDFPITDRELSALSFALQSEIQKYKKIAAACSPAPSSNPTYLETLTKVVNRVDQLLGKG